MRKIITDEDVQRRIDFLRKMAGSDDLHAMIKVHMQHTVEWNYWFEKTREIIERLFVLWLLLFSAVAMSMCFYFWAATTLSPVWVGVTGACFFAVWILSSWWLSRRD